MTIRHNEAIERIIKAVGSEPDSREQLANDLDAAFNAFANLDAVRHTRPVTQKQIERARKAIGKSVFTQPEIRMCVFGRSLQKVLADLDQLEKGMSVVWPKLEELDRLEKLQPRRTSALEYLTGFLLPRIFEARFGLPTTWTRRGEPDAPIIDFIDATIKQLGIKNCSRETIGKAISELKQQRLDLGENQKNSCFRPITDF